MPKALRGGKLNSNIRPSGDDRENFIKGIVEDATQHYDWDEIPLSNSDIEAAVEAYAMTHRGVDEDDLLNEIRDRIDQTTRSNEALEYYASGEGMYINQYLRGRVGSDFSVNDSDRQLIKDLQRATQNTISVPDKLYRSVDAGAIFGKMSEDDYSNLSTVLNYGQNAFGKGRYAESLVAKANNYIRNVTGVTITEKGFLSTTKDYNVARNWGGFSGSSHPVVLEINTGGTMKGADLKRFDVKGDEQREVLGHTGQRIKVREVTTRDKNIYVKVDLLH